MQPQLFLFDEEGENSRKILEEEAMIRTENITKAFPESLENSIENEAEEAATETEISHENPFAEIQKKQQDKIDMLLLTTGRKRGRKSFKEMDEEAILPEVPDDEVLNQKQYYPTRVVADWFGVTTAQLRAWENEFDILKPKRNGKGDRFFRPEDVRNVKLIYHLIRRRKFTVQGAKQYLEENKTKLQTTLQLTESLNKFRQFLLELKAISG